MAFCPPHETEDTVSANTDLDDLLDRLRPQSAGEALVEIAAARRAAESREPQRTIIPDPELPPLWPRSGSGIVRFPCVIACGWAHEEGVYESDAEPISVPLSAGAEELNRVLTERAERRSAKVRARAEAAVREHFAQAHPEQEPPEREVW